MSIRESMILKIQTYFRMAKKRKQIINIFDKDKNCYLIKCKIKFAKNVQLKVLFKDKTEKKLDFHLCPIRKTLILYIEKKLVREPKYYVNFIADGNTIIDPLYRTDYDKEGNFYNIIDFEKLDEEQREKELERDYFYRIKSIESLKRKNKNFFDQMKLNELEENEHVSSNDYEEKGKIKINYPENKRKVYNRNEIINYDMKDNNKFFYYNNKFNNEFNKSSGYNFSEFNSIRDDINNDPNIDYIHSEYEFYDDQKTFNKEKLKNKNAIYDNRISNSEIEEEEKNSIFKSNILSKKNKMKLNSSLDEFENDLNQRKRICTDIKLNKFQKKNSLNTTFTYEKNSFNINNGGIKHVYSTANLKPGKSILKSPSNSKCSLPKKVSFGNVQFS